MFLFLLTNEWWGGIRPSAGVVLPLLPPALLHYTINRRKLQAVRQKICAKKVKMLGGCALRGTGSTCRCGKLNGGGLPRRCRRGGRQRYPAGGLPGWSPAYPAFSLLSCPLSPHPPSPVGKGETQSLFRRGLRPRHPCIRPFAALIVPAMRAPHARSLRFAAKTIGSGSLLAVPAAKERGDRGRWNYPSQATAAFEMVLSPGAGIASAARVQLSPLPRRVPQRQGQPVPQAA